LNPFGCVRLPQRPNILMVCHYCFHIKMIINGGGKKNFSDTPKSSLLSLNSQLDIPMVYPHDMMCHHDINTVNKMMDPNFQIIPNYQVYPRLHIPNYPMIFPFYSHSAPVQLHCQDRAARFAQLVQRAAHAVGCHGPRTVTRTVTPGARCVGCGNMAI